VSTLVIGHRGASGYRPEHTRSAYELAFALGADAVEPDIVASKDGVLVVRHENEISGTTDVAEHPEFGHLRTTKVIDGETLTGWFTEDFTWAELSTLRARERLPALRTAAATFDGRWGILRLSDLRDLIDEQSARQGRELIMVAELKHATYFASIGLPLDELFADEMAGWATPTNLIVESFEQTVLGQVQQRGIPGRYLYLLEKSGSPADRLDQPYAHDLTEEGLAAVAERFDGISVDKTILTADLVDRLHAAGLLAFTWTLRAENQFLPTALQRGSGPGDFGDWRTEFRLILGTGVDGVFADQPDLAVDALEATVSG
jgi:glycerophosphoryl diester phosphodiesterase